MVPDTLKVLCAHQQVDDALTVGILPVDGLDNEVLHLHEEGINHIIVLNRLFSKLRIPAHECIDCVAHDLSDGV